LDLTLTARESGGGFRAPMCGVPFHAVTGYIARLIKADKQVAICEQLSAPGDQKGMLKRDVVRLITPGTITDEDILVGCENNFLLAVYKNKDNIAFAISDISTGEMSVLEFDEKSVSFEDAVLNVAPKEILASESAALVINEFESVKTGKLPRAKRRNGVRYVFKNAEGFVLKFFKTASLAALGLQSFPDSVCALSDILGYIEDTQKTAIANILPPKIVTASARMFLDNATQRNLELLENLSDGQVKGSLLGILDKTCTSAGARLLRKIITEPVTDEKEIFKRQDCVDELERNAVLRQNLQEKLRNVRDIQRLSSRLVQNTASPRDIKGIAVSVAGAAEIKELLKTSKAAKLVGIYKAINTLSKLTDKIERAIVDNPPLNLSDGGVVKSGYNKELDGYRNMQSEGEQYVKAFEERERGKLEIKNLKVGYNRVFGYYIEIPKSQGSLAPMGYIRKQTVANAERYTSAELTELENAIRSSGDSAARCEATIYNEIREELKEEVTSLVLNAQALSFLDVYTSFAQVADENNYCRPVVSQKSKTLEIQGGRHPTVEAGMNGRFIPNDSKLIKGERQTLIITGPNMAGKSTYMRQNALIALMAHIGSFVPARSASMPLFDRIFTRIGASDNLSHGQSTFMLEMSEVALILNQATSKSLLILDEVGRGTSTLDGLSVAWAIAEHLSLKIGAFTLFATHYHELSELSRASQLIKNLHFLISESENGVTFLYKAADGSADKSFGIEVAELAGVNANVIKRSKEILSILSEQRKDDNFKETLSSSILEGAAPTEQLSFFEAAQNDNEKEVLSGIRGLNINSLTPLEALTLLSGYVKRLK
jgi:DNA mismatch repair protein MutS